MLRFCGFTLELVVEDILEQDVWPTLCSARDPAGCAWIIIQIDDHPDRPAWLCAPVSERAADLVGRGRATALDAVRHSATGTVELVALHNGQPVPDRCLLCSNVNELLATFHDEQAALAA
jgi:hypothetical protein